MLVSGTFSIPDPKVNSNPRWRTGERTFRLTSSSTNSQDAAAVETAGNAEYVARGLLNTLEIQLFLQENLEVYNKRLQKTDKR